MNLRQEPPPGLSRAGRCRALGVPLVVLLVMALLAAEAMAAAPPRFVGLQGFGSPSTAKLDAMQRAKVTEFRKMVRWRGIEPTRPTCTGSPSCHRYRWANHDALFAAAAQRNIRILPYILGSPEWVRSKEQYPPMRDFDQRAFNDFVAAFTKRYGPHGTFWMHADGTPKPYATSVRAHYLQIWNEPNLGNYWNNNPVPWQYARMLTQAGTAAKAADPDVRIVSAGLPWGKAIMPEEFLRKMYAYNRGAVASKIDAIGIHVYKPYPHQIPPALRSVRSTLSGISTAARTRPIWVTEMGWATGPYDGRYQVSEQRQADNLKDAYARLIPLRNDSRYNVDRALWFGLLDVRGDGWWHRTGLFRRNGTAKPSWSAFKQVSAGAG